MSARLCIYATLAALSLGGRLSLRHTGDKDGAAVKPYKQVLHNYQNVQYFADFKIGGQPISGIFDTGSFELLVRSTKCSQCVHPTPPYDEGASHTFHANGTVTRHVFGSGPCISVMGYDDVDVGHLHAPAQAFWEIVDHRIQVLDTAKFAAIVGIGPNFAYGNKQQTLLMSYGVEDFSVCLQTESGSDGYLTWGSTRGNLSASPDYATARVIGNHHWSTKLENVTFDVGGHETQMPCSAEGPCVAIVDSGTSLIAAPGMALMQLSSMIPEIKEDCSNIHELPTLRFIIDGHPLELPPQAYVMRVNGATLEADDVWDILFFKPKMRKLDMCMPAFMQIDMATANGPVWILGMPFFRYYHTTFDRTNQAMHFSKAGKDCEPEPLRVDPVAANISSHKNGSAKSKTESLLAFGSAAYKPMDVDVDALISPTLSGMMDYPLKNGEYPL